jgi:inositol polyphosphate 5-phosphatase INPP5B/F
MTSNKTLPHLFFGEDQVAQSNGISFNPKVISFIRDEWIHEAVAARESEFTEYRPLRVFVGTYNVNGKVPKEDLTPWLCEGGLDESNIPDVYVCGLQEMVDLTATNVALQTQCGKRAKDWSALLESTLNAINPRDVVFELVSSKYLVGVFIAVLVKRKYRPFLKDVQDATAAVGVMGMMGNKGGAAIRFRLFDSTFCFICAHLAAHRGAVAQRNADFASIMAKLEFKDEAKAEASAAAGSPGGGAFGVMSHECIVFFGDFNYRIAETVSTERCFELAKEGGDNELEYLVKSDQLNIERAAGRSFQGFIEGPLTFRPTYKYQQGTSNYEQRAEKKLRAPAWCDRILWRTNMLSGINGEQHLRQLYYGSVDSLVSSDHKPVHALFEIAVKSTIISARAAVLTEIMDQLDAVENKEQPIVKLSFEKNSTSEAAEEGDQEGEFGSYVRGAHIPALIFGAVQTRTCILTNVGAVAATWRFVGKPEEKLLSKPWISVEPLYGMLLPNASVSITISFLAEEALMRDISLGRELAVSQHLSMQSVSQSLFNPESAGGLLEDILVLRTERGRDFYIPVSAVVIPSCFGCSLAQLSRRPEPMRALPILASAKLGQKSFTAEFNDNSSDILENNGSANSFSSGAKSMGFDAVDDMSSIGSSGASRSGSVVLSIPKEIWRLCDVINSRGLSTRGIFSVAGDPADLVLIRECLDTGDPFPPGIGMTSYAHCLIELVSSFRESVIPSSFFPNVADILRSPSGPELYCRATIPSLPALHFNVLLYLIRFAREVLSHASFNASIMESLAFVFSRCLFRKSNASDVTVGSADVAAAAAASTAASSSLISGDDDEAGSSLSLVSALVYADRATKWEPLREEQEAMVRITVFLFSSPAVAFT